MPSAVEYYVHLKTISESLSQTAVIRTLSEILSDGRDEVCMIFGASFYFEAEIHSLHINHISGGGKIKRKNSDYFL